MNNEDKSDESDVEIELDNKPEKDETEEELERLVFGDSAGFRDGLRDLLHDQQNDSDDDDAARGLEGLEDAQVGEGTSTSML